MAQQFEVQALGLNGIPYRIEIYNSNYGGTSVTQLDGDQQFIRFEGGQRERVGIEPIWGKEVRINVRTNEDLSPLFGLEDRDAEVRVYRTDTSSLVWKGFILTDFFQDEPLTDLPGVELRAVDGLTTLEGDSFDALSGVSDSDIGEDGSFISYTDLFTGVLSTLYDSPLDVEFAVEWYPDAGGQLTSSDNPLRYSGARPDVYYNSDDGAWFDQRSTLEDALKSQGLEVRQSVIGGELTWLVAQPTALSASSVKTWRYAPGGTEDASSPFTRDLSLDLSSADTNRPTREFERRSGSVSVMHDHEEIGNLVEEPGFESGGAKWNIQGSGGSLDVYGGIVSHSTPNNTPPPVQENQDLLRIKGDGTQSAYPQDTWQFPVSQVVGEISGIQPNSQGRLRQSLEGNKHFFGDPGGVGIRFSVGNQYLTSFRTRIRSEILAGSGSVPIGKNNTGLQRAIPKGAVLPIVEDRKSGKLPAQLPQDGDGVNAVLTLSERAEPGDDRLVGDVSAKVSTSLPVSDLGKYVLYPGFVTGSEVFRIQRWMRKPRNYPTIEVLFAYQDANGQPLTGQVTYEIGGYELTNEVQSGGTTSYEGDSVFADDISFSLERDGQPVTKTTREASVPTYGQGRELSVRLSSGPTLENPRRVKGFAPGDISYQATDWGVGAGGGSLSLAGLQARERLRYLREHLERQQLTVYARDKSPVVTGEEIVQFDGKTWRIAEFSSDPASGEIGLTLIQHADAGTTDLSIATVRDTEDGGTSGGGGGTAPAVGGGGGGAAQKAEIGAFRPGSLTFGNVVLSHVVAHEWQVNSVIIKVTTPPASAYDFDIDIGGTVVTVTLPGGQSLMTASIDEGISAESEVRVTAKSNDTDIEDIRTTLDVS